MVSLLTDHFPVIAAQARTNVRIKRHPRAGALLSGINVIPAQAGIYKPVTNGIMDTRLRV